VAGPARLAHAVRLDGDVVAAEAALIQAQPELGIRFVSFDRFVWSFTGGALIQRALANYLPLTTLVDLVRKEATKLRRS